MKIAWATDLHLDHVKTFAAFDSLSRELKQGFDALIVTGDTSTRRQLGAHLNYLSQKIAPRPVYFVLGNHDIWGGSFKDAEATAQYVGGCHYLPLMEPVPLKPDVYLIGADGWYDFFNGGPEVKFYMNDWDLIIDFKNLQRARRNDLEPIVRFSQMVALESARLIERQIRKSVDLGAKQIFVATHIPPWAVAHRHLGQPGDNSSHPLYTSKLMGRVLDEAAEKYLHVNFTVLAGHTHGHFDGQIHSNMRCCVGGADYGQPKLQTIFEI